jgi:hypothetical protein
LEETPPDSPEVDETERRATPEAVESEEEDLRRSQENPEAADPEVDMEPKNLYGNYRDT